MSNSPTRIDNRMTRGRRLIVASAAMVIATMGVAGIAEAKPDKGGCPPAISPWLRIDLIQWRKVSVDGLIAEFGSMDVAAKELGFADVAEIEKAIDGSFKYVDANEDGHICVSSVNPGGLPDYLFSALDNRFNARFLTS
jgi:hypothetical protein